MQHRNNIKERVRPHPTAIRPPSPPVLEQWFSEGDPRPLQGPVRWKLYSYNTKIMFTFLAHILSLVYSGVFQRTH